MNKVAWPWTLAWFVHTLGGSTGHHEEKTIIVNPAAPILTQAIVAQYWNHSVDFGGNLSVGRPDADNRGGYALRPIPSKKWLNRRLSNNASTPVSISRNVVKQLLHGKSSDITREISEAMSSWPTVFDRRRPCVRILLELMVTCRRASLFIIRSDDHSADPAGQPGLRCWEGKFRCWKQQREMQYININQTPGSEVYMEKEITSWNQESRKP